MRSSLKSKVNLGHWWNSLKCEDVILYDWRLFFLAVLEKEICIRCACLPSPLPPEAEHLWGEGEVVCPVYLYTQWMPFAQPTQGEPWLGYPQSSLLLIGYLGMLEQAEESECGEEEMYGGQREAGCIVLRIFRGHVVHTHEDARDFILKKIYSDRSSPIFTVYVCKPIVKVLQWFKKTR